MMTAQSKQPSNLMFILNCIVIVLLFGLPTVLLGGNWLWLEGWLFGLWMVAMVLSNYVYLYRHDPALLAERSKRPGSDNQKGWDKYLSVVILALALAWLIVTPLDAQRFHWSPAFPVWLKALGGLALLPALYLIYRATVENTFLSAMVRIQTERKQRVISTGVYGFVRHPLYLGCMFMILGAPLLLGSIAGLVIDLIAIGLLMGRILGEEQMLVNELEGYEEYRRKVRYRLIPWIW